MWWDRIKSDTYNNTRHHQSNTPPYHSYYRFTLRIATLTKLHKMISFQGNHRSERRAFKSPDTVNQQVSSSGHTHTLTHATEIVHQIVTPQYSSQVLLGVVNVPVHRRHTVVTQDDNTELKSSLKCVL